MAIKLPLYFYSPRVGSGVPGGCMPGESTTGVCQKRNCPLKTLARGPLSGNALPLHDFELTRSPAAGLKGALSRMNRGTSAERALLREAFDLLLELRSRPQARKLLGQAVTYLRMLERQGEPGRLPLVISVRVMRLGKF